MFVFSNLFRVMEIYENLYQKQYLRIISVCFEEVHRNGVPGMQGESFQRRK